MVPPPHVLPVMVAAGVLVRSGDEVLLQRRRDDGTWGPPGGALHPGESLEEAARRELHEETGLTAGSLELIDVYSGSDFLVTYPDGFEAFVVGATFSTTEVFGDLRPDADETLDLGYFPVDDLPENINAFNRLVITGAGLGAP